MSGHERAKKARGEVNIDSKPGEGTRISLQVTAPKPSSLAPAAANMG